MQTVEELQRLDPGAWTHLLARGLNAADLVVTDVSSEPCGPQRNAVRYLVTLYGYSDRTTFIGKQTNAVEARFYRETAVELPPLTPRCWQHHVNGEHSWLLLDEVHNDRPPAQWTASDVETVISSMAALHAATWNRTGQWIESGYFPYLVGHPHAAGGYNGSPAFNGNNGADIFYLDPHPSSFISDHALKHSGRLAPAIMEAAQGLARLQAIGGWPGVLDAQHLLAAGDLIDDPLPMTLPLLQLPPALLHGDMAPRHWRLSLFNEPRLLDWRHAAVGAAVYDLVSFIEQFGLLPDGQGKWALRQQWPANEETMIDSYLLHMSDALGSAFNARAVRQAIPAARCLFVLTTWLPRFAGWLAEPAPNEEYGTAVRRSGRQQHLAEAGLAQMVGLQSYLAGVFKRFISAYKLL